MAKQIIILDVARGPGGDRSIRTALWFPIAQARRVPRSGATSVFRDATMLEIAEIQNGAVIEEMIEFQVPTATTIAQTKALLEARYTTRAAEIAGLPNPNQFYGTFLDSTAGWSA